MFDTLDLFSVADAMISLVRNNSWFLVCNVSIDRKVVWNEYVNSQAAVGFITIRKWARFANILFCH